MTAMTTTVAIGLALLGWAAFLGGCPYISTRDTYHEFPDFDDDYDHHFPYGCRPD